MAKKSRLDSISVPKPCAEEWNKMDGGEKSRFCGICEKNVYNISAMTAREADKLLFENTEKVCIRMEKDADGKIKTLKNQLHQITRQTPIAAGVLSATLAFSAVTLAQGEPVKTNLDKVNIIQTAKDEASKPSISGTIYDEVGAIIPNVAVALRNVKDNSIQKTVSNGDGVYLFGNIEPSVYEIETDNSFGFKKFIAKNIEVSGKNNLQLNLTLQVREFEVMGDYTILPVKPPDEFTGKIVKKAKNNDSKTTISGTITDRQGLLITSGVKITLSDIKNKSSQKIVSNSFGEYRFANVENSVYEIEIEQSSELKGFSYKNITVDGKDDLSLNIALEPSGEWIGVVAGDYLKEIDLPEAKIEEKLNFEKVKELPPYKRDFIGLPAFAKNKQSDEIRRFSLTVVDVADAIILSAEAELINQKTKQKFIKSSNKDGIVEFKDVPLGKYKIRISANGFKSKTISLSVDEKTTFDKKVVLDFAGDVTIGMYIVPNR